YSNVYRRYLHSFPTRRSSDLEQGRSEVAPLSRSVGEGLGMRARTVIFRKAVPRGEGEFLSGSQVGNRIRRRFRGRRRDRRRVKRSEEHTSELQSLRHLVCRLL